MKSMFRQVFLHWLLCSCTTQVLGVLIQTAPGTSTGGVIVTELNKTVSLVCHINGSSYQDGNLVWLRNGATISLKEGNTEGRSSVCITPVIQADNGATFTCYLSKNSSLRDSITLNVTYGPQLSGSEEITVEKEEALVLQCDIWANPPVQSVSWTFNNTNVDLEATGLLETTDGFNTKLSNGRAVKSLHEGTYECSAIHAIYGRHTKTFYVTVTEKTFKFPLFPMIAGLVVVFLTILLAIIARCQRIMKCFQ